MVKSKQYSCSRSRDILIEDEDGLWRGLQDDDLISGKKNVLTRNPEVQEHGRTKGRAAHLPKRPSPLLTIHLTLTTAKGNGSG